MLPVECRARIDAATDIAAGRGRLALRARRIIAVAGIAWASTLKAPAVFLSLGRWGRCHDEAGHDESGGRDRKF
jgi:hypothetical protein